MRLAAVLVAPGAVVEGVHGGVETHQHEVAVVGGEHSLVSTQSLLVLQKVPSEANPKVRNHGEGPY